MQLFLVLKSMHKSALLPIFEPKLFQLAPTCPPALYPWQQFAPLYFALLEAREAKLENVLIVSHQHIDMLLAQVQYWQSHHAPLKDLCIQVQVSPEPLKDQGDVLWAIRSQLRANHSYYYVDCLNHCNKSQGTRYFWPLASMQEAIGQGSSVHLGLHAIRPSQTEDYTLVQLDGMGSVKGLQYQAQSDRAISNLAFAGRMIFKAEALTSFWQQGAVGCDWPLWLYYLQSKGSGYVSGSLIGKDGWHDLAQRHNWLAQQQNEKVI